jgi:hypothetical protein
MYRKLLMQCKEAKAENNRPEVTPPPLTGCVTCSKFLTHILLGVRLVQWLLKSAPGSPKNSREIHQEDVRNRW